ncbi:MAG: DNA helicase UvrD [Caldiserica bacterium]|nr:MAG: DNA helicase UvrD [Caldisericota bacterium]
MRIIADLHIHSKYSRATSRNMEIPTISKYAKMKGIGIVATGDFTHPLWMEHLKENLEYKGKGVYEHNGVYFILSTEVSCIYSQKGKTYRIHHIIYTPTMEEAEEISRFLSHYGNLMADGRPIISLDSKTLVKKIKSISKDSFLVPAHIWTPWFSLFGSNSGFDSIDECFDDAVEYVFALETGLSSDPPMNWKWSKLDRFILVSNSDAHSPDNLGREANIFELDEISFFKIRDILKNKDKKGFLGTIEFFPEEGKYHYDGHRECGVSLHPLDTKKNKNKCPRCGKPLTIGVLNRVYSLSDRDENSIPEYFPFRYVIPLREIIAEIVKADKGTKKVKNEYEKIVSSLKNEFYVLLDADENELYSVDERIGEAIIKMRKGEVEKIPGYDGVFGKIKVKLEDKEETQPTLF